MPHFKDSLDRLYFLSDEDITNGGDDLLPTGCAQITDEQADALRELTAPMPEVVDEPPQITEAQAAKLIAFLKANPDIVAAAQL